MPIAAPRNPGPLKPNPAQRIPPGVLSPPNPGPMGPIAGSKGTPTRSPYASLGGVGNPEAMTSTNPGQPPPPAPPPFNYTPPNPGTFGGQAPTPTPYGDFTAPDPNQMASDPYYQFRSKEGEKAIQRSAAARGTLLSGGTLKSLEGYRQGLASEEGQHIYDRALTGYTTNRDTNAQNYGQQMGQFHGNLDAFNANTNATLGYGRLGLDSAEAGYDRQYDASQGGGGGYGGGGGGGYGGTGGTSAANDYAQQAEQARVANDQELAVRQRAAQEDAYRRAHMAFGGTLTPQQLTNRRPFAGRA